MAYASGTANSLPDLLAALRNFCIANGWALSGDVLHKAGGPFIAITTVDPGPLGDQGAIMIRGGNGIDGGNNLTDMALGAGYLGPLWRSSGTGTDDWSWPVTFHLLAHEAPSEVYLFVNYNGTFWQNLSFGRSPAPGCPGTGNWFHGFHPGRQVGVHPPAPNVNQRWNRWDRVVANPQGDQLSSWSGGMIGCAPFWWQSKDESSAQPLSAQFHGCMRDSDESVQWSDQRYVMGHGASEVGVSSSKAVQPLPQYSPNAWNNEAHLIRWYVLQRRDEFKSSVIGELKHLRFVRNDFLGDGEVIQLGDEKWKVFPFYRKNAAARNGVASPGGDHSGTQAMAVRYDGP